jgi:PAS domain S-box-containing protein
MLGYSEGECWTTSEQWFGHIHADDRDRVRAAITAHRDGKISEVVSGYRMRQKSGGYIWTLSRGITVRGWAGKAIRMVGTQTDITEGPSCNQAIANVSGSIRSKGKSLQLTRHSRSALVVGEPWKSGSEIDLTTIILAIQGLGVPGCRGTSGGLAL